jgi:NAD(P)-dependent dehydrogenase (short-subunit alcohol dehydrogenase family)
MAGQIVVVTGASTGIGQVTALHLARRGFNVYATMRNPDRGAGPLTEAAGAEKLALKTLKMDVDQAASVTSAIGEVLRAEGRVDVLVNNAGIGDLCVIERTTDEMAHAMFETNVHGVLRATRAVLPGMRERRSGAIVNVASVAGHVASMGAGLYAATKHALEAISESLALETRPFGIRVAVIEPGFFKTPIIDKAIGAMHVNEASPYAVAERRIATIYSGANETGGDPLDVAKVIEYAITTDAPKLRYMVGADAKPFAEGRARLTDEEWVDFGREMSEDEFWAEFARIFPMPTA